MSLRARLALVTVGVTALVLVAAGTSLVALVQRDRESALDRQLTEQAEVVAARVAPLVLRGRPLVSERLPVVRVSPNLHLVARILADGDTALVFGDFPLADDERPPAGFSTVESGGVRWRILSVPVERVLRDATRIRRFRSIFESVPQEANVTVEVAAPTTEVDETVREVTSRVILLGSLAMCAAAIAGWAVGAAVLRPLRRLEREAERVKTTSDLRQRVPSSSGLREVDEFAATLNAMLDRLAEASEQREEALESARAFAAHAAHELRTPLTSIRTNLEVLANPSLDPAERAAVVQELQDQHERMIRLLEVLRMLARGDLTTELPDEEVSLADIAAAAVSAARIRHPEARFELRLPGSPPVVSGWAEGLRAMLDNLLDNAAVHGRRGDEPTRVTVTVTSEEDLALVVVEDDGPGIPAAERDRVFERFERGSTSQASGSGLGLALVVQQARLHGGDVVVTDAEPHGARFEVRLRAASTQAAG
ncbi:MAG: hypothetical protein KatS3mg008_1796 [Acidimicrobiales bacterium]|nr:MAG: hypothetical protein KatS3mg008_1796 [Acidimicrobiales bacterium]